jgi:hypothetical protein
MKNKELLEQTKYLTELLQLFLEHEDVEWFELEGTKEEEPGLSLGIANSTVSIYIEGGKLVAVLETSSEIHKSEFGLGDLVQIFSEILAEFERLRGN